MARPRIQFTPDQAKKVETLARANCTDEEIAAATGIAERTLIRRFGPILQKERKTGQAHLRAKQYELAMKGDRVMLIWLGKNLLAQKDQMDVKGEGFEPTMIVMPLKQQALVITDKAAAAPQLPTEKV